MPSLRENAEQEVGVMIEYLVVTRNSVASQYMSEERAREGLQKELALMDEEGWRVVGFSVDARPYGKSYWALLRRETE